VRAHLLNDDKLEREAEAFHAPPKCVRENSRGA
jgi:hypothetical protein